jgi:hypothetical protein
MNHMGSIRLAALYCSPFEGAVFPWADRVTNEIRAWLTAELAGLGLGHKLEKLFDEVLSMCSYLYPGGCDEGLFLVTTLMTLQYVEDDLFDGAEFSAGTRLAGRVRAISEQPHLLAEGIMSAVALIRDPEAVVAHSDVSEVFLLDAWRALSRRLHRFGRTRPGFDRWLPALCDALARFAASHAHTRRAVRSWTVAEYETHKFANSGMEHTIRLIELARGRFLTGAQHEFVAAVKDDLCRVGSLLNEIISYEKEVTRDHASNLLRVMELCTGCSLADAATKVGVQAQQHAAALQTRCARARRGLADGGDEARAVLEYVADIERLAAACWDWQLYGTSRFRSPTSPFTELVSPQ